MGWATELDNSSESLSMYMMHSKGLINLPALHSRLLCRFCNENNSRYVSKKISYFTIKKMSNEYSIYEFRSYQDRCIQESLWRLAFSNYLMKEYRVLLVALQCNASRTCIIQIMDKKSSNIPRRVSAKGVQQVMDQEATHRSGSNFHDIPCCWLTSDRK